MSLGLFRHWLIILVVYLAMNYPNNDENTNISITPHYPNCELPIGGSWSGPMHSNNQSNNVLGGGGGVVVANRSRHVVDRRIGGSGLSSGGGGLLNNGGWQVAFGISKHPLAASVDRPLALPKRKSKRSSLSSQNVVQSFPRVAQSLEVRDHDIHVVLLNYFCDSKRRDLRPPCRAMDKLDTYEKCKSYGMAHLHF